MNECFGSSGAGLLDETTGDSLNEKKVNPSSQTDALYKKAGSVSTLRRRGVLHRTDAFTDHVQQGSCHPCVLPDLFAEQRIELSLQLVELIYPMPGLISRSGGCVTCSLSDDTYVCHVTHPVLQPLPML